MPIYHHFSEHDFGKGFSSHSAILDQKLYEPQLLIIGTYNPKTLVNESDFFYHRNYFWPTINNLFQHNELKEFKRRDVVSPVSPTQLEILSLCQRLNLTFADLINCVLPKHGNTSYVLDGNVVTYQGAKYNLIEDKALEILDKSWLIEWSTKKIIEYLKREQSIRYVRFTRQPTGVFKTQWELLTGALYGRRIDFGNIHSPSAQGLREKNIPAAKALAKRWLFHSQANQRLPDAWVRKHLINKAVFNY